jgi:hypothetical protein
MARLVRGTTAGTVALAAWLALAGCTSQQMYAAGQGWQRTECSRMPDGADRDRCLANAERSYDAYRRGQ